MELLAALRQSFDYAGEVVAGVGDDQLARPTPCSEWDVATLLSHMGGVVANMGRGARRDELLKDRDAYDLGGDRAATFRSETASTLDAWSNLQPDDLIDVGAGPMPVGVAMRINLVDTTTHAWDLASATGQKAEIPDELATTTLEVAQSFITDELRALVGFEPPKPVDGDASPTARLVCWLGRASE
jgi:uncharacterized protein (TIGR03086 family)